MSNYILGALRKWGKTHGTSFGTSAHYRRVAVAAIGLRRTPHDQHLCDVSDAELGRRTFDFACSAELQRELELHFHQQHARNLNDAIALACESGIARPGAQGVVHRANAARHKKWALSDGRWVAVRSTALPRTRGPYPLRPPGIWRAPDAVAFDFNPNAVAQQTDVVVGSRAMPREALDQELVYNYVQLVCGAPEAPLPGLGIDPDSHRPTKYGHVEIDFDNTVFTLSPEDIDIRFSNVSTQTEEYAATSEASSQTRVASLRPEDNDIRFSNVSTQTKELAATSDASSQTRVASLLPAQAENDIIDKFLSYCHDGARSRLVDIGIQTADCAVKPRLTSGTQTTLMPIQPMMPPPPKLLQPYVCNIPRTKLRRSPDGTSVPIPAALARSSIPTPPTRSSCGISGNKRFLVAILLRACDKQPLLWRDWRQFVLQCGSHTVDPLRVDDRHLETYLGRLYGLVVEPATWF